MIAIAFFMTYFGGMLLVAFSHLFGNILSMFLISYIGNWLDKKDRKYGKIIFFKLKKFILTHFWPTGPYSSRK
jgi:hypothetical protein